MKRNILVRKTRTTQIKAFWAKFYIEEKLIVDYLGHLQDIDHRKGIRTRTDTEEETTRKKLQWFSVEGAGTRWKTRRARELDIYLKRHGLTTIGRKDDKVKAIRCNFFPQTTNPTTDENESDEWETSEGETDTETDVVVLADFGSVLHKHLHSINSCASSRKTVSPLLIIFLCVCLNIDILSAEWTGNIKIGICVCVLKRGVHEMLLSSMGSMKI